MDSREKSPYVAVVGGVNVDIGGIPFEAPRANDSSPGVVRTAVGGVGQNIARNLRLLGVPVTLLTAFGWDEHGRAVQRVCESAGIDLSSALQSAEKPTSVYLYIADEKGDMQLAVSDMDICRLISPDYLAMQEKVLNGARAVVMDANIPKESVLWLAEHVCVPLYADPVSLAKAEKLRPVLGRLHALKPNRLEAEILSGIPIRDEKGLRASAEKLLSTGLRRVFISLGAKGVYAADPSGGELIPCCPARAVSMTGAGDAFLAGLVRAGLDGLSTAGSARFACAVAAVAVESAETVNPRLSLAAARQKLS